MILSVPPTATSIPEWIRRASAAIGQLAAKKLEHKAVSATYTLEDGYDVFECDTTSAAFTITLTPAAKNKGRIIYVKRVNAGANVLTIDGSGSETIDGAANSTLTAQWESKAYFSNGSAWLIL